MTVLIVCGTGTGIGKTHVGSAILRRAGRERAVLGYKPVESGCASADPASDFARLAAASSFHVKQPPEYALAAPVSPHLSARLEGRLIDLTRIVDSVRRLSADVELLLVELAGGLFSPLGEKRTNADLVRMLEQDQPNARALLVAPDRLGVLHDVGATTRAAAMEGARLDAIVLNAVGAPDASMGTNAAEMALVTNVPVLGKLDRGVADVLADSPAVTDIVMTLLHF